MNFPFYSVDNEIPKEPVSLPTSRFDQLVHPAGYVPDPDLEKAVNVALLLGQPLLLTGAPGSGKTVLASHIAWKLGFADQSEYAKAYKKDYSNYQDPVLKFETKSTSNATDLFYTYNSLGHFRDKAGLGVENFIHLNALGQAILQANKSTGIEDRLKKFTGFVHSGEPKQSVVLIDEIDKAPRDFPNDLLNEIERMYFRIAEMNNMTFSADPSMRPIVIITSNSEKNLPDAFLRRCVYYHIPFPEDQRLRTIISNRLPDFQIDNRPLRQGENILLDTSLTFFSALHENPNIKKSPSIAELLGWLTILTDLSQRGEAFSDQPQKLFSDTLSVLIKLSSDLKEAERMVLQLTT